MCEWGEKWGEEGGQRGRDKERERRDDYTRGGERDDDIGQVDLFEEIGNSVIPTHILHTHLCSTFSSSLLSVCVYRRK